MVDEGCQTQWKDSVQAEALAHDMLRIVHAYSGTSRSLIPEQADHLGDDRRRCHSERRRRWVASSVMLPCPLEKYIRHPEARETAHDAAVFVQNRSSSMTDSSQKAKQSLGLT